MNEPGQVTPRFKLSTRGESPVQTLPALLSAIAALDPADLAPLLCAIAARMAEARQVEAAPLGHDDFIDVHQAAQMLGVSASWLHHRPDLPFRRKIGGKVKFSRSGIQRWRQRDHG